MSLFNRKQRTSKVATTPKAKRIQDYNMMESVSCDLESAINNEHPGMSEHCWQIAETDEYEFYNYQAYSDGSGGFVLRRSKQNHNEVVFFGLTKRLSCVFHGCLFQTNHTGERDRFYILCKEIETGKTTELDWLGKGNRWLNFGGYLRCFCQDTIKEMYTENQKLILKIAREKSEPSPSGDDPAAGEENNRDMEYRIEVVFDENKFKPTAIYPKM